MNIDHYDLWGNPRRYKEAPVDIRKTPSKLRWLLPLIIALVLAVVGWWESMPWYAWFTVVGCWLIITYTQYRRIT